MKSPAYLVRSLLAPLAALLVQPSLTASAQTPTFGDVPADHWAFGFIEILGRTGVTGSCGNGNYCPDDPVTRAQMAVFLERGMRGPYYVPPAAAGDAFADVRANDFASAFIEQLFVDGITAGCGNGNYCPSDPVTRAQMAVFLLRAMNGADYVPPTPTGEFGDVPPGHWAAAWVEQLAAEGVTTGCGAGNFCPGNRVSRAQMAVFLVRAFDLKLSPALPTALYVLGDSLSDTGNAAGAADLLLGGAIYPPDVGLCNPYDVLVLARGCDDLYQGHRRVTDGPVAAEYVATYLGIVELEPSLHIVPNRPVTGTNYAVASGKASGIGIENLTRQVDLLLVDEALALPSDALYIVIIGGNDAIDALQALQDGAGAESVSIIEAAVDSIGENAERLIAFGARRLIVANAPDLAVLPSVITEAQASGDPASLLAAASGVTADFNDALDARLDQVESTYASVLPAPLARFDLSASLASVVAEAEAAGNNVTDPCFDSEAYRDSPTAVRSFHPDCAPVGDGPPRFGEFVFWDGIHPTGATHAAVAQDLIALIPATAPAP